MYLYTQRGDQGKSLIGGKKVSKDNYIISFLGDLDEINSLIGVVKSYLKKYRKILTDIQENLFIIQANISYLLFPKFEPPILKFDKIKKIEREIEKIEKKIKLPKKFVIPGKEIESAWLHYLRAIVRRLERNLITLNKKRKIDKNILIYFNRLSSYLYALALYSVFRKKLKEDHPTYR
ncbi:MAG: cob(I)yrinic acid a,c-diamide adenosyltransferase [Patescibacteria group bacterium]|nr:cob(I)yrinic acid a,c-diamide adenosyltransferase [Patescibacteria group bacterium]